MRDCTSSRLRGLHPVTRITYRRFRLLAPVLLILGILAASDSTGQQTQPVPVPQQKLLEKTKDFPKEPPPPVAEALSRPTQAVEVKMQTVPMSGPTPRFQFNIDPKAPLKDLLPT